MKHQDGRLPKVLSNGKSILLDSQASGDEPFMLAKNLPRVVVLVGTNRIKAGYYAIDGLGVNISFKKMGFNTRSA
jgi:tetraacyldisaccharide 4'-kinase